MANSMNTARQPQVPTMALTSIGVITGPSFTDDWKMPDAVPFSVDGNQWLMVLVTPIGKGASAMPRATRHSFRENNEPDKPMKTVDSEVRMIERENTLRTPNLDISQADGNCTRPYASRNKPINAPASVLVIGNSWRRNGNTRPRLARSAEIIV